MDAMQEWLEQRTLGLGGSDMGAVLGVSPYKTAYEVWLEKTRRVPLDSKKTAPILRGIHLESVAADVIAERTGLELCQKHHQCLSRSTG